MCRAGGRRCEHNWSQSRRDEVNARRRQNYQNRKANAGAANVREDVTANHTQTPIVPSVSSYAAANSRIANHVANISKINEEMSRELNLLPAAEHVSTMEASTKRVKDQIKATQDEIVEIGDKVSEQKQLLEAAKTDEDRKAIYSKIEDFNKEVIAKQAMMQRQIKKLDEREQLHYGLLGQRLNDQQKSELRYRKYEDSAEITKTYTEQIEVIGIENVDVSKISYSDHASMKNAILSAGIKYPAPTYWDEMGSSDKDIWEEGKIRQIQKINERKNR